MRILYIITQADGGGAQKYTLALAKHFNGAIAAGNEAGKLFINAQSAGLETFELQHLKRDINLWQDAQAVWEIRDLIKFYRPDIVHLNSSKAGILGSFARIGTKAKIVFTAHGFVFNEPLSTPLKMFYLALEKVASSYRDFIITVSDADKKSALDNNLIAINKIQTIHNGLPQINFLSKDEAKRQLGISENKIIIGNTSNFYKTKGLDVLIEAVSLLSEDVKAKSEFVIIGDGSEKENLKSKITNLKLDASIKLLGKIDNASDYLKAFDLFTLPSRKEGLPFALLEAMQAGLPIIASNVGGIPEALGDAEILVEPENPKTLADALSTMIKDEQKRSDLSAKALERSKLFIGEKMLTETNTVYKKIIS